MGNRVSVKKSVEAKKPGASKKRLVKVVNAAVQAPRDLREAVILALASQGVDVRRAHWSVPGLEGWTYLSENGYSVRFEISQGGGAGTSLQFSVRLGSLRRTTPAALLFETNMHLLGITDRMPEAVFLRGPEVLYRCRKSESELRIEEVQSWVSRVHNFVRGAAANLREMQVCNPVHFLRLANDGVR